MKRNDLLKAYVVFSRWAGPVVLSLFLLLIRIIWGCQFFITGKGKLGNLQKVTQFFTELHIPAPGFNAVFVAIVGCFGGLLLLFGLASRPIAFILTINMCVAYITADRAAMAALFKEGDVAKFSAAAPFWFLVTSILVLALGPGIFSADGLIRRILFPRPPGALNSRSGFDVLQI